MKKEFGSATVFYIISVLFCISAVLNFVNRDTSMGVVWLALGSTFLCLGSAHKGKSGEEEEEHKDNKPE